MFARVSCRDDFYHGESAESSSFLLCGLKRKIPFLQIERRDLAPGALRRGILGVAWPVRDGDGEVLRTVGNRNREIGPERVG